MVRSDLTANNLPANAVAANPMLRTLSSGPAPSITSSVVSQFDSKGGSEDQNKMMQDVSGISTPMGTPRAAGRDLEGSVAGSVRGGSVADIDDLGSRLEGLDTSDQDGGRQEGSEVGEAADKYNEEVPEAAEERKAETDKEEDVEMTNEGMKSGPDENTTSKDDDIKVDAKESPKKPSDEELALNPQGILQNPDAKVEYTVNDESKEKTDKSTDQDPNQADDLDALKEGKLEHDKSLGADTLNQAPAEGIAESALELGGDMEPRLDIDETKHQGGVAGQRMQDVENADEVIQPDDVDTGKSDDGPEVRDATPSNDDAGEGDDVVIEDGENLGPRGTLDGPQKFKVEFLEKGRGQEKAAELDQQEYQINEKAEETEEAGERTDTAAQEMTEQADEKPESRDLEQDESKSAPDNETAESSSTNEAKPIQVQIEPAPIAQPATESSESNSLQPTIPDTSDEATPSVEIDPPTFPAPPSEDPDVVDPISNADSGTTTPLDPSIARTFPDVPDEEKPRVQVHVSSPLNTPQKEKVEVASSTTPLAELPGKSKSLSSLAAESEPSEDDSDTPEASRHKRRLSARKSPKSPLLDDEDPGDFEPGEGFAVVYGRREETRGDATESH
jgi:hypothetical protein